MTFLSPQPLPYVITSALTMNHYAGDSGSFLSLSDRLQLLQKSQRHLCLNPITSPLLQQCKEDHQTFLLSILGHMLWTRYSCEGLHLCQTTEIKEKEDFMSHCTPTHAHAGLTEWFCIKNMHPHTNTITRLKSKRHFAL